MPKKTPDTPRERTADELLLDGLMRRVIKATKIPALQAEVRRRVLGGSADVLRATVRSMVIRQGVEQLTALLQRVELAYYKTQRQAQGQGGAKHPGPPPRGNPAANSLY